MQANTLPTPRNRYFDLWVFLALLVAGFLIALFRSPVAFIHPAFFAEDGTWIDIAINQGPLKAILYGRAEFPAFIQVGLDVLALYTTKLIYGFNLSELPRIIALYSYTFYSFCAVCGFYLGQRIINKNAGLLVWAIIILLPLSDANITLGRNLQWQFVTPFLTLFALHSSVTKSKYFFPFYLLSMLTFLSFPPCLLVGFAFIATQLIDYIKIEKSAGSRLGIQVRLVVRNLTWQNWLILASLLLCVLYIVNRESFTLNVNKDGDLFPPHAINFIFYRVAMYPFTVSWTSHLNDLIVLLFTGIFFGSALIMGTRTAIRNNQLRFWLFFVLSFLLYWASLCVSKHGLSHAFAYNSQQNQHYFLGLDMFTAILYVYGFWPRRTMLKEEQLFGTALLVLLSCLLLMQSKIIFQTGQRQGGIPALVGHDWMQEVIIARDAICTQDCDDATLENKSHTVRIYPSEGSMINLPWRYLNTTANRIRD